MTVKLKVVVPLWVSTWLTNSTLPATANPHDTLGPRGCMRSSATTSASDPSPTSASTPRTTRNSSAEGVAR